MASNQGLGRAPDGPRAPQGHRDTGEDVAAHHGLAKMIPRWQRGNRAPRERYRLLYLRVCQDMAGDLSPGMAVSTELALRLAEVRSRAARLSGPGQIRALEAAAMAKPREAMTPAGIRVLAAESTTSLQEVAASSRNCRRCPATTGCPGSQNTQACLAGARAGEHGRAWRQLAAGSGRAGNISEGEGMGHVF